MLSMLPCSTRIRIAFHFNDPAFTNPVFIKRSSFRSPHHPIGEYPNVFTSASIFFPALQSGQSRANCADVLTLAQSQHLLDEILRNQLGIII